jgi:hypothetical protein
VFFVVFVVSAPSMTMAAAGAIRCLHSPNGDVQWLRIHRAIHAASHQRIRVAIKTASEPSVFIFIDN